MRSRQEAKRPLAQLAELDFNVSSDVFVERIYFDDTPPSVTDCDRTVHIARLAPHG
jgi:hypothetical protein